MQLIGGQWRQMQKDQRNNEKEAQIRGPRVGDKSARSQRKVRIRLEQTSQAQRSQKAQALKIIDLGQIQVLVFRSPNSNTGLKPS